MEKRILGENVTLECRRLSYDELQVNKRCKQIIEVLKELKEATAMELAYELFKRGYVNVFERNTTAPRLTEMSIKGIVEPIGKKKCSYQGKMVSVYAFTKEFEDKYLKN